MATKNARRQAALTISPTTEAMLKVAHAEGVPREQMKNFLSAGVILQPRQFRASAAARAADEKGGPTEIGYGGARGGGKSHWMLAQMGADDCQRVAGLKCLLLRKVGKSLREGFEDLLPRTLGNLNYRYVPSASQVVFDNDSRILLGHFQHEKDVETYLGLEYDVIGVEEATTLSASKYKMIRTCNRTSKADWRPRMYTTTNPGGMGHTWYRKRFIDPARKGTERWTRFIPATVRDNAFLNDTYVANLEDLTGWQRRAWLEGDWDIAAGQYFENFNALVHVQPWRQPPGYWRMWGAFDYGFVHYTMFYLMAQDGDGRVYVIDELAARKTLIPEVADGMRGLLERNGVLTSQLECIVAGHDVFAQRGGGDGATIAEQYEEEGFTLSPANIDRINGAAELLKRFGNVDKFEKTGDLRHRPTIEIADTCHRLVDCIPAMEHDPGRPEDVLKWDADDEGIGGDDPYDAVRYGTIHAGDTVSKAETRRLNVWKKRGR